MLGEGSRTSGLALAVPSLRDLPSMKVSLLLAVGLPASFRRCEIRSRGSLHTKQFIPNLPRYLIAGGSMPLARNTAIASAPERNCSIDFDALGSLVFEPKAAEKMNVRSNSAGRGINSIPGTMRISFESWNAISASPLATNSALR